MVAEADNRRFVLFTPMMATIVVALLRPWPAMLCLMACAMLAPFARLTMLTWLTLLTGRPAVLMRFAVLARLTRFAMFARLTSLVLCFRAVAA